MLAAKTSAVVREMTEDRIKNFMSGVRKQIPVGKKSHKDAKDWDGFDHAPDDEIVLAEIEKAHYQIGTLGGGKWLLPAQENNLNILKPYLIDLEVSL